MPPTPLDAPASEHSKSALIVQKLEAAQHISRFESVGRRPRGAGVRGAGTLHPDRYDPPVDRYTIIGHPLTGPEGWWRVPR